MGRRGAFPFENKVGVERLQKLSQSMTAKQMAELFQVNERTVRRALERMDEASKQDRSLAPIEVFDQIPEVQAFVEYQKAKGVASNKLLSLLRRMWVEIRNSGNPELVATQRPALWGRPHVQFLMAKVGEWNVARYNPVQALRQFFKSSNDLEQRKLVDDPLLKARRRDMRPPTGTPRSKDRFTMDECFKILEACDDEERFILKMHVTLKCREGGAGSKGSQSSLLGLDWGAIDWADSFYGFDMVSASVFESKTGGGTWWRHCPIDLWWADLSEQLRLRWGASGQPKVGKIFAEWTYRRYLDFWEKINEKLGTDFEPHDCRRSPSGWLRDLGLPDLALGHHDPRTGEGIGYCGVGWENAEIFYARYGKLNPLAIYNPEQMDVGRFDGLILRILESRTRVLRAENAATVKL